MLQQCVEYGGGQGCIDDGRCNCGGGGGDDTPSTDDAPPANDDTPPSTDDTPPSTDDTPPATDGKYNRALLVHLLAYAR